MKNNSNNNKAESNETNEINDSGANDQLTHYKNLLLYLGQLELSIIESRATLEGMESEKRSTIDSLRSLRELIDKENGTVDN